MKKRTKIILGVIATILVIGFIALNSMYVPSLKKQELSMYEHETIKLDNGMETNYKITGNPEGKPIVFIHGGSDNLAAWDLWSEKLQDYRLISVDLPGHGLTDPFPDDLTYSAKNMADFIDMFTTALELENFVLVGHSMGGEYSMKYVIDHPEKVEALTVLSPGCYRDAEFDTKQEADAIKLAKSPMGKIIPYFMESPFNEAFIKTYIGENFAQRLKNKEIKFEGTELALYEKNRETMLRLVVGMYDNPFLEGISTIKQKTLILWGDQDAVSSVTLAPRLNSDIENSKLVVYENVGHTLQLDYPDSVNDFVRFLKEELAY